MRRVEELLPVLGKRIKGGRERFVSGRLLLNNAPKTNEKPTCTGVTWTTAASYSSAFSL